MKAGSATNLLSSRIQSGRVLPRKSCDSHGNFGSEAVEFRPESEFLPSTSSNCSIRGCRDSRRTYISDNPQCSVLGRLDACLLQAGRGRKKPGPGVGAPRRPARFDVVIRRLYRASRRRRVDDRVATRRLMLRRKHRLLPRTPVHRRGPGLPRQRPGPNLTGMARGRARGKRGVLCETPQRGAHIKRVIKRRKRPARGRRKRSTSCGRLRGSAFVSSVQPSDGHKRRVGRKTPVRRSQRYRSQSSKKRHGSSHWEPDPTRTPSGGRNSDAQHGKEVTREVDSKTIDLPTFRRKRMRLSSAPRSCLSGKLASKHEGATGVRLVRKTQVVCDSRSKGLAASDVPEGSHVEAQGQNNGRTENDVIVSEWDFRRGTDRWGSRVEQRRYESIEALLKFFLRTKRDLAEVMVSWTAVGRASDQQM